MTPVQIALVQNSWDKVDAISDQAASLFYDRLFTHDPALKPLFKGNMEEQGKKLMTMIGVAVRGLDKLDTIVPAVQKLGARHKDYGVKPADYDTVAQALLWTLGQGLGDAFDSDTEAAWVAAYTILATTMIAAADY
ncbi:globin family protein [Alcanivorax sp.]|jgi:hemoglobin-like flavoprotein|uniref:globin family protein n=1 Tax=Alcanivorax sp. TaxID=1872427 RepID=UPI00258E1D36|nr:globin family protein [uncultured Alcanivorax sp.]